MSQFFSREQPHGNRELCLSCGLALGKIKFTPQSKATKGNMYRWPQARPRRYACLCFLFAVFCCPKHSVQTCTELNILGINPGDKTIKVKEHTVFNMTARFDKNCHDNWNWSLVKLSTYEDGKHLDICKIILHRDCNVSGSSACTCLSKFTFQFHKRVTREDSKVFMWKWTDSQSPGKEKQREITLIVDPSENNVITLVISVTFSCLIVAFASIAVVVFLIRRSFKTRSHVMSAGDNARHESSRELTITSMNGRQNRTRIAAPSQLYNHLALS